MTPKQRSYTLQRVHQCNYHKNKIWCIDVTTIKIKYFILWMWYRLRLGTSLINSTVGAPASWQHATFDARWAFIVVHRVLLNDNYLKLCITDPLRRQRLFSCPCSFSQIRHLEIVGWTWQGRNSAHFPRIQKRNTIHRSWFSFYLRLWSARSFCLAMVKHPPRHVLVDFTFNAPSIFSSSSRQTSAA